MSLFSLFMTLNEPSESKASTAQFAQWYEHTYQDVFRYIYAMQGGPPQLVEDLTAEAFLKAWQNRKQFHGSGDDALRWVLIIARNLIIDHWRQTGHFEHELDIDDLFLPDITDSNPENQILLTEKQLQVRDFLQRLPVRQREVLVLRYMLEWKVKEIGYFLNISENAVSTSLRRARQRFEQEWKEEILP